MPQLIIYKNTKAYKEFLFSSMVTISRNKGNKKSGRDSQNRQG